MTLSDEQLRTAQWTYVLGLSGLQDVAVIAYEATMEEFENTPAWHWLRRRRLSHEGDAWLRLAYAAATKHHEQDAPDG